jgi:O-antigen ligase
MLSLKKIENKEIVIFKFLFFIWILAIPFKNAVYQVAVASMIIFFFVHLLKNRRVDILIENFKQTKYLTIGFFCIIISMFLSNLFNLDYLNEKSWRLSYMFFVRYALVFILLSYFYRLDFFNKKEITISLFSSFILLGLTGVFQILLNPDIITGLGITGTLDNRNAFGLFMGMGFVLSLVLIKDQKVLGLFLILFFSFLMIFSFSRSSWVASACSVFIMFILNYKKIKIIHFIYLVVFCIFIVTLYFTFDSFQERFKQLLEADSSNRTTIWMHTIVFIKEKILFGYGVSTWKLLPDTFLNQFPDPHNMILEILIYTGFVGLTASIFSILIVLIKIFTTKNFILFPIASYFLVVTQFDFGAFGSKEILSFLTIFVFFIYSDSFKVAK